MLRISLNVKHYCFIFQHIVQVRLNICPICQQASECPIQRTMLPQAAVQATDEQLIANISICSPTSYYRRRLQDTVAYTSRPLTFGQYVV